MHDELALQVSLELIPGIGVKGAKQLMSHCGSASEVFSSSRSALQQIPGIREPMIRAILDGAPRAKAEAIIAHAHDIGVRVLHQSHPDFPRRLAQVADAPNVLYVKGTGSLNPKRSIAVVGTRKATDYGKSITNKIVGDLAQLNATVISGLAYGIDIEAHRSSLEHHTPTLAVLAGGLDTIYPAAHRKYIPPILENGAILSESIPGTEPEPYLFPARNRIIAGMADATIVVEAATKGGALITANLADSYHRAVFAVPGDVGHPFSEGTNHLIATQQALIYTGIENLVYQLNWDLASAAKTPTDPLPSLTDNERTIYQLLEAHRTSLDMDQIVRQTQLSVSEVSVHLLSLEFKNLVKSLPGKKFRLVK